VVDRQSQERALKFHSSPKESKGLKI